MMSSTNWKYKTYRNDARGDILVDRWTHRHTHHNTS